MLAAACGEAAPPRGFQFDEDCVRDDALDMAVGESDQAGAFDPIQAGEEPMLWTGPQGGRHFFLYVSVANPCWESPGLRVEIVAEVEQACPVPGTCEWDRAGWSVLEMPGDDHRLVDSDGALLAGGLLVVIEAWPADRRRRVLVDVIDACRRAAAWEQTIEASK